ncbi:egg cell-secreted protein 1.2-like [Vicia villosa]|uniref:egg cell-secreted protein 1.2-like n=1 Tax=Vicia villosa TaxID=3911 RepID=UPI00273C5762|nr:egg cell-secreted protein 1.2-like [Vicia villosa]
MASMHKLFVLVALVIISLISSTSIVESRKLSNPSNLPSLEARLKVNGTEPSNCWESLFKLQACSGEIITFFINGETYLGNECCKAIRIIGHDCWPKVVASLGFTNLETYTLEGYCDDVENVHSQTLTLVEPKENIVP